MLRTPPDILITTPESLFLLLTSQARETLRGVETVILDEVHAVAGTKRGSHLALSLERLERLVEVPFQRVGLSATQRPLEEIGRFVAGTGREIELVDAGVRKELDLQVVVPVEDMRELGSTSELSVPPLADGVQMGVGVERSSRSIWPSIYPAILELVRAHRSTIVFVNNRRLAERLALRINELAEEELARAHHGSLAREQRLVVEELLKAGKIPCLVATSSLELGIDMGAVDLVIQVESPKSVASGPAARRPRRSRPALGLEGPDLPEVPRRPARVGGRRACDAGGRDRGDAHPAEPARRPRAADRRDLRRRGGLRRRAPRARAARVSLRGALAGTARERPRHARGPLSVRRVRGAPSADRLGPDRRHRPRANGCPAARRHERGNDPRPRAVRRLPRRRRRPRRRARRGDGVRGTRGPDLPARRVDLADRGDHARPRARLAGTRSPRRRSVLEGRGHRAPGRARGADRQDLARALRPRRRRRDRARRGRTTGSTRSPRGTSSRTSASRRPRPASFPPTARSSSSASATRSATGASASSRRSAVACTRRGRWPCARVCATRSTSMSSRCGRTTGSRSHFPDADVPPPVADLLLEPDEIEELLLGELAQSALYGARFRENAARALLIPRRRPGQRTPLWQQRLKAQSLLQVARRYPQFPIVLETYRECLQDVFDLPALRGILRGIQTRSLAVAEVETVVGVPVRLVAPLRVRRDLHVRGRHAARGATGAGALARPRPAPRADGHRGAARAPRRSAPSSRSRRRCDRRPATSTSCTTSCGAPARCSTASTTAGSRRRSCASGARSVPASSERELLVAVEDAGLVRDAFGVVPPGGVPQVFLDPVDDALRGRAPAVREDATGRSRPPRSRRDSCSIEARIDEELAALERADELVRGELRPGGSEREWCDPDVLRRIRRATLAVLRREVEPAEQAAFGRFLPAWHGIGRRAGSPRGARPAAGGRRSRRRSGRATCSRAACRRSGPRISTCSARRARWSGSAPASTASPSTSATTRALLGPPAAEAPPEGDVGGRDPRGARRARPLLGRPRRRDGALRPRTSSSALWELVWAGEVTNDSWAPLRASRRYELPRPDRRGRRFARDTPDDGVADAGPLVARVAALRRRDRSPRARRAPARAPGHRHA